MLVLHSDWRQTYSFGAMKLVEKSYLPCLALEIDQVFRKYQVSLLQPCMFQFPLHPPGFYFSLFLISLP